MTAEPELLCGKYRLLEPIGQGGMAVVFAAQNVRTERQIAIKRLLPARMRDPRLVSRFEREARAAGRIRSRHVIEIFDVERDDKDVPFLVMERLFGENLSEKIRREKRLMVGEALDICAQILAGLAEAHGAGVIHRDLKASNVFLEAQPDGDPVVKIVDFGISKLQGNDMSVLTAQGDTIGTLSSMPPEQLGGAGDVTPASDLWAVGVLLFRMLTGRNAFVGGDTTSLVLAILNDPTPQLTDACDFSPEVIAAVQPIIDRALQRDPAKRYWGADKMREAVHDAAHALGMPDRNDTVPGSAPAAARGATLLPGEGARVDSLQVSQPTGLPARFIVGTQPAESITGTHDRPAALPGETTLHPISQAPKRRRWLRPLVGALLVAVAGATLYALVRTPDLPTRSPAPSSPRSTSERGR